MKKLLGAVKCIFDEKLYYSIIILNKTLKYEQNGEENFGMSFRMRNYRNDDCMMINYTIVIIIRYIMQ